jgi:hypothetical protein
LVEDFANNMSKEEKPFYIVYACKPDTSNPSIFRQAIKAYYKRPEPLIGILVWYVNHPLGIFEFMPELSAPPDIPLDDRFLSKRAIDVSDRVARQGKKMNVLLS